MKKLLLTICTSLFCVLSYAQTEHLTFKGLPIDGNKQEFVKELKRCGYIVHIIVNIVANYFLGQKNGGKFSPPAAFPFLPIFSSFDFYK